MLAYFTQDRIGGLSVVGLRTAYSKLMHLAGDIEHIVGWPALAESLRKDAERVKGELARRGQAV